MFFSEIRGWGARIRTWEWRNAWEVYAPRAGRWVGRVIAHSADSAIEAAAVEFDTDAWKLIAVNCDKMRIVQFGDVYVTPRGDLAQARCAL